MSNVDVVPPPPEITDVDLGALFLPDPEPRDVRYTIISADDHVLEPPHTFQGRLPQRLQSLAPRLVDTESGHQAWEFDGKRFYEWGDAAVAGRAKDLVMRVPFRYEYVRPGCYDIEARIRDMDINGVWASLNFPSFVTGFCGRVFSQCSDAELGLATTRAWNDWLYEEWYSAYPQRIIPLGITCLNDPDRGAEEIRRNAARGFRSVSLPERPHRIGLPSLFSGHWDPIVRACAETETVISLHVGSTGLHEPPPDVDQGAWLACITALFGQISMQACVEWLISGYPVRHPNLKIAMSEGGIGWVAMLIDRLDNMIDRSPYSTLVGWDNERPADVLRRNFWFCTLDDPSTLSTRHVIGIDNILAEVDYPHGDGTWPDTQQVVADVWGGLPPSEIRDLLRERGEAVSAPTAGHCLAGRRRRGRAVTEYQPEFELPTFNSLSELREHRKQRLAATFRILSAFGLDDGTNGHASARDPERTDWFWTNPPGMHFAHVRVSDLLLVDADGVTREGPRDVDRVQRNIHAAVLAARSDIASVVHAHGIYGRAWSTQLRVLDPITQDACAFYGDQSVMVEYSGVVADPEEGKRIAYALGPAKVVVLANHGILTVGPTVDEATWWFVNYERMCQVQLVAESAANPPRLIPTDMATATAAVLGSSTTACFQFQPLYDWIVRREPDLLT